ncbi:MAG: alpha-L-rhamnosidase, partial [Sphingobacteriales bacterium]
PGTPTLDAVTGCVVGSATTPSGDFESSDAMVNQLYSNIKWGQRGNFLSIPTDCPQRDERVGWMGDAQVFARTAAYNMDVQQFFTKWLRDVTDSQTPAGSYPPVAPVPAYWTNNFSAGWADAGVIIPWQMYQVYGDRCVIENNYASMVKYIDFVNKRAVNYLLPSEGFGDWLNVKEETPKDLVATAYYANSVSLLSKIAGVLGKRADSLAYDELHHNIKAAFNKAYVSEDGKLKGNTQTGYLLALSFDLLPQEKRMNAGQLLVENIKAHDWHLTTGFVGVSLLCPVLSSMGYDDVAYRLLNTQTYPSWLYSVKNGATTIWERWNSYTKEDGFFDPEMNSYNHYCFGSVGEWMYSRMVGIDLEPAAVAYKKIIMRPTFDDSMTFVKGRYHSVYGEISSSWKREGANYVLNITIPANSSATLYLPGKNAGSILEDGTPLSNHTDIKLLPAEGSRTVLLVGSGSYSFSIKR